MGCGFSPMCFCPSAFFAYQHMDFWEHKMAFFSFETPSFFFDYQDTQSGLGRGRFLVVVRSVVRTSAKVQGSHYRHHHNHRRSSLQGVVEIEGDGLWGGLYKRISAAARTRMRSTLFLTFGVPVTPVIRQSVLPSTPTLDGATHLKRGVRR
ncbi:hypothetical protein BU24DRAFT_33189 [Aaosphaeria arxii CBS 175.79]|uniref:Uncharacterized protein n=1 Tax=Aaosphaeria arxii CBS 175.79 TaxID=1450172 RepID=A0A6A5Y8M3_9PLEO|nr:uncharacterized protein BU24DRAFT_33189 [Aaosphaeria arxii CBS 175.79]KAF2021942.1 hypothetical protein BU24DRAFT_33189 [Aaosphaeria arxii CBS 175.79]